MQRQKKRLGLVEAAKLISPASLPKSAERRNPSFSIAVTSSFWGGARVAIRVAMAA